MKPHEPCHCCTTSTTSQARGMCSFCVQVHHTYTGLIRLDAQLEKRDISTTTTNNCHPWSTAAPRRLQVIHLSVLPLSKVSYCASNTLPRLVAVFCEKLAEPPPATPVASSRSPRNPRSPRLSVQAMGTGLSGVLSFLRQVGHEQAQMRKVVYGPTAAHQKLDSSASATHLHRHSVKRS